MKKSFLIYGMVILIATTCFVSCNLLDLGKSKPKTMAAADAKVEIRSANQSISDKMDAMLSEDGFSALNYLMTLMTTEENSFKITTKIFKEPLTYTKALNIFRENDNLKSNKIYDDDSYYGIYEYNFETGLFDLVEESNSIIQYSYPANETALLNQNNNCVLKITNLEFTTIISYTEEYNWNTGQYEDVPIEEEVPVSAQVSMKVDGISSLTCDYNAAYTEDGLPTEVSFSLASDNYEISMSFSGNSTSYNTKLSQKLNKEEIMGYDIKVTYTADMETVQKVEGYYLVSPLKFEGDIDVAAIETYSDNLEYESETDIDYLNSLINIQVIQVDLNGIIGHLEYKMYDDTYETYVGMAIVYDDGTYDWLEEVMTVMEPTL